jgi:GNAT superfamily N-acetyltransferase
MEWHRGDYRLTDDPAGVDVAAVHAYLTRSYWAEGIPLEVVRRSIAHSLNFSLWHEPAGGTPGQVGFARIVTDFATVAYLGDVYVLEEHRGRGLSVWTMEVVATHPRLQGLRRWILLTRDAHGLYRKTGWTPVAAPERYMEKRDPDVYRRR